MFRYSSADLIGHKFNVPYQAILYTRINLIVGFPWLWRGGASRSLEAERIEGRIFLWSSMARCLAKRATRNITPDVTKMANYVDLNERPAKNISSAPLGDFAELFEFGDLYGRCISTLWYSHRAC